VPLQSADDARAVRVSVRGDGHQLVVGGVDALGAGPRVTRIGEFKVDVAPRQTLLVLTNTDVPGVIGHVGTLLGSAGVNIAEYHQARLREGGEALAAIAVDGQIDDALRRRLLSLGDIHTASVVRLGGAGDTVA
ncbi:MAG: ACT domain-containing protein, partial [Gemmatimonadaceae bacterium]